MPAQIDLDTVDPRNDQPTVDEFKENKRLLGIVATVEGPSATGESLSVGDLGDVKGDIFGRQRFNVPMGFFHSRTRIHEGEVDGITPTNGSTRLVLWLPMYVAGGGVQTIEITDEDDVDVEFQFDTDALTTIFNDTPSAHIRAMYADRVPMRYVPEFIRDSTQHQSASKQSETYTDGNVPGLYLREKPSNVNSDIVERADVTVDNANKQQGVDLDETNDGSVITGETYAEAEPWKHIDLTSGPPSNGGFQNGQVKLEVTTNASGIVQVVKPRRVAL